MNYYRKAIEQGYEETREWMEQLQKNLVDETITDIEIPHDKSDEELYKVKMHWRKPNSKRLTPIFPI